MVNKQRREEGRATQELYFRARAVLNSPLQEWIRERSRRRACVNSDIEGCGDMRKSELVEAIRAGEREASRPRSSADCNAGVHAMGLRRAPSEDPEVTSGWC